MPRRTGSPDGPTVPRRAPIVLAALALLLPWSGAAGAAAVRYEPSSNRIYVERGHTVTLSQIKRALPGAPLELVDPARKVWLLRASIRVKDGSTLLLRGGRRGGDVNELRLRSNNAPPDAGYVEITVAHGQLRLESTRVVSWDTAAGLPDADPTRYGRAFIRARSRVDVDRGRLESRMDVIDSVVAYLGFDAPDAYGLSWRVTGARPGAYHRVNAYGTVAGSRIHHNWFGLSAQGAQGLEWRDSEIDHSVQHALVLQDQADGVRIERNSIHHNGAHGLLATRRCARLQIRNNRVWGNALHGLVVHTHSNDALIEGNDLRQNGESGVAVFAAARATIRGNRIFENEASGIRLAMGASDARIEKNEIASLAGNAGELGRGFCTKRGPAGPRLARGCPPDAVEIEGANGTKLVGNTFATRDSRLVFSHAPMIEFDGNTVAPEVTFVLTGSPSAPTRVNFSRQPQVQLQLDRHSSIRFEDPEGAIFDLGRNVYTVVNGKDSFVEVPAYGLGPTTTVVTRKLVAQSENTMVSVHPTLWDTGGDRRKAWKARTGTGAGPVRFTVGDLRPGVRYVARQESRPLGSFVADAEGRITFSAAPGANATVSYTVIPN